MDSFTITSADVLSILAGAVCLLPVAIVAVVIVYRQDKLPAPAWLKRKRK